MYRYIWKIVGYVSFVCLIFVSASFSSNAASGDANFTSNSDRSRSLVVVEPEFQYNQTDPHGDNGSQQLFMPLVMGSMQVPYVTLIDAWTEDESGSAVNRFAPDDSAIYLASGTNSNGGDIQANINWTQESPCGITTIYSDTVSLSPGEWEHSFSEIIPDCTGHYTNTVRVNHNGFESVL